MIGNRSAFPRVGKFSNYLQTVISFETVPTQRLMPSLTYRGIRLKSDEFLMTTAALKRRSSPLACHLFLHKDFHRRIDVPGNRFVRCGTSRHASPERQS